MAPTWLTAEFAPVINRFTAAGCLWLNFAFEYPDKYVEMNSESCPNLSKSVSLKGSFESWLVYCALSLCCGRHNVRNCLSLAVSRLALESGPSNSFSLSP